MIAAIKSPPDLLSEPRRKSRQKPGQKPAEDNKDPPPA
jgi:hypothetical protein